MITQERLKELLHYDPETGVFVWKVSRGSRAVAGNHAGCVRPDGYIVIGVELRCFVAHRLAFLYMDGLIPKTIDHVNGVRNDNRWSNLRPCTIQENNRNRRIGGNTSGVKGVHWDKSRNKWVARVGLNYKTVNLGGYDNIDDAATVIKEYRDKEHAQFANHG